MVIAFDHISVLVADLTEASIFYEQVLGLERVQRPLLDFEGLWLSLGAGQTLHLLRLPNPDQINNRPAHAGRDRHIALRVTDMDSAKNRLSEAGIAFTVSRSGRNSIFCRDKDGNGVELMGCD
jgi:glyoxylase I family protein